jgi:uncharacterized membrane protein YfcA
VAVGAIGTLIGAGGGFLLVPILIFLYPGDRPEVTTSTSLAIVFLNALSGTIAYGKLRRIDYRSGLVFAAATIPGAVLGALTTSFFSRRFFDTIFGIILTAGGLLLLVTSRPPAPATGPPRPGRTRRVVVESDGTRHEYSFSLGVGIAVSVVVGFASSLLGIGGGIIHVPALIFLLSFPAHVATATSHFILVFMALAATIVHLATGTIARDPMRLLLLGGGALVGAQLGARWSQRVRGRWIVRGLGLGLMVAGIRIFLLQR